MHTPLPTSSLVRWSSPAAIALLSLPLKGQQAVLSATSALAAHLPNPPARRANGLPQGILMVLNGCALHYRTDKRGVLIECLDVSSLPPHRRARPRLTPGPVTHY